MFEFDGDWTFKMEFKELSILADAKYNSSQQQKEGIFEVLIIDEHNFEPEPHYSQINTLEYLSSIIGQKELLESIKIGVNQTIYPLFRTFVSEDEYPDCFPKINSVSDLPELLSLNYISILPFYKDNFAYYALSFDTCLDYEHGISLTMHNNHVIAVDETWNYEKIFADAGIDSENYHNTFFSFEKNLPLEIIKPHAKYDKLKPWQKTFNHLYPFKLLHKGDYEKIIKEIDLGIINPQDCASGLLEQAIDNPDAENLVFYLSKINFTQSLVPINKALRLGRFEILDNLLKDNYDLNSATYCDFSPLYFILSDLVDAKLSKEAIQSFKTKLQYLIDKGFNPYKRHTFNEIIFESSKFKHPQIKRTLNEIFVANRVKLHEFYKDYMSF